MKTSIAEQAALSAASVDRLAILNAEIASLTVEAQGIKQALIATGVDEHIGILHKAVITHSIRETLDSARVKELLSADAYASCLKASPVHSVRMYGL